MPDDLLDWLTGDAPPILFTHGSAQLHGQGFFATAVETARRLGRRALLVASRRESLPAELPAGMRHEAYLPFSRVLPHCAALVSHGGVGTCAQALAAGVPHLVVPMAFDQFDNASRLVELGVGDCLPVRRLTTDRAVAALRPLLSRTEDVRARCAEGAPTLRGETRVAEELETLHGG
ncbi:MAG: nucleotide disphospho-sugar-binding domain-containing protein [Acidobacteriota bacterium]